MSTLELGRRSRLTFSTAAVAAVALTTSALAQTQPTAYVGATVHTMAGEPIEVGTVLVRDGHIEEIAAGTNVPAGYESVDLSGKHLLPGMVLAASDLGLVEIDSINATNDSREVADNNADLRAELAFHADSYRLPATLAQGVTTTHAVLGGGRFTGQTAVLRMGGWNWRDMTMLRGAFQHLDFPSVSADADSESGALKELDELVESALEHRRARDAGFVASPAPKLDAIAAAMKGETRLLISAGSRRQVAAALEWTEKHGIEDWVLLGGQDAMYEAEQLAAREVPVLLRGVLSLPDRATEAYDQTYRAAVALNEAGVKFAIVGSSDSTFHRNLMHEAAMAVAFGLDEQAALRSVTQWPAEILGIADRVGSLAEGMEATFFVTEGDPLEITSPVVQTFVRGERFEPDEDRQYQLWQKYRARPKPTDEE